MDVNAEPDIEYFRTLNRAFDEVATYSGRTFSHLRTNEPLKLNCRIDKETLLSMGKYLDEWNVFDSLSRVSDFFRLSNAKFTKKDNDTYSLDVDGSCLYQDYEIARNRLMMRQSNLYSEMHTSSKKGLKLRQMG